MEGLDILKKEWQQSSENQPKLSYNQIYNMWYKKSTSIVKWIFIISIAELLLWSSLSLITPKSTYEIIEVIGASSFMIVFNIIHYFIFIIFIVVFIKNYLSIKTTDSTKELMNKILRTRKTVRYFVIYNVIAFALAIICFNIFYYLESDLLIQYLESDLGVINNKTEFLYGFFVGQLVISIIMLGLLILFYRIVYGVLLKRLHRNYQELKKIEL